MPAEIIEDLEKKVTKIKGVNGSVLIGDAYRNLETNKGLILLPGLSEHRISMSDMAKFLSQDYNVWAFDLNAQGDSTGKWDLREMADSIHKIVGNLKEGYELEKIGLFGNSMGGMAGGIAASYTDSPLDVLCLSTTGGSMFDYTYAKQARDAANLHPSIIYGACVLFDWFETLTNKHYRNLTHKKMKKHPFFGATKLGDPKEFFSSMLNAPQLIDYADKIEQPTLLIKGDKDLFLSLDSVQQLYEIIPGNKQLWLIKGADHSLNGKTPTDSYFNHDSNYQFVKSEIKSFFNNHM